MVQVEGTHTYIIHTPQQAVKGDRVVAVVIDDCSPPLASLDQAPSEPLQIDPPI